MSERERAKKDAEERQLELFFDAYAYATDRELTIVESRESPDFICSDRRGVEFGIELGKVMRSPDDQHWDWIFHRKEEPDFDETIERMWWMLEKKEKARQEQYSQVVSRNILVLELTDGSLCDLVPFLDDAQEDFVDHGFEEVWLADYSGVDAYGDVELFGLFPEQWWGFHERPDPGRKPYG